MTAFRVFKIAVFISLVGSLFAPEPRISGIGPSVPGQISQVLFADLDQDGGWENLS
jgi:hypothetical protein